jgi:uncharacterized membrane protein
MKNEQNKLNDLNKRNALNKLEGLNKHELNEVKKKQSMRIKYIMRVALIIVALYAVITIVFALISYLMVQVRVSEALTILPFIFPEGILGLFLGCLIIYGGLGFVDKESMRIKYMMRVALIAALYVVITIVFAPISYLMVQVRVSEALTILPFIFPESILGLFLGCLIANIYGGLGFVDIVFGSLATLIAAYLTSKVPSKFLAPLPPILVNAVIVSFILNYMIEAPIVLSMLYVGCGQFVSCYLLGLPLLLLLKKYTWKNEE